MVELLLTYLLKIKFQLKFLISNEKYTKLDIQNIKKKMTNSYLNINNKTKNPNLNFMKRFFYFFKYNFDCLNENVTL